ncbi:MAG: serine/threonine protein kinase [Spirulinaceae cyanobacterium]
MWETGHTIQNGRYRIQRKLGGGGFGITYLAEDVQLGRKVVIKAPNEIYARDQDYEKFIRRFQREGQALAKIKYPNVVQVIDFYDGPGIPYLVMDYVEGKTLSELVRNHGKFSQDEAVQFCRTIAQTLYELHKRGIIHCDLHPGNIILESSGKPVLIDFGSAKFLQPTTFTVTTTVNENYAPYEQRKKDSQPEPQWDVYALAATLYFTVTGQKPESAYDRKLFEVKLKSPRQYYPELSQWINDAILQGMALESKERTASMQAWLGLLHPPQFVQQSLPLDFQTVSQSSTSLSVKQTDVREAKSIIQNSQNISSAEQKTIIEIPQNIYALVYTLCIFIGFIVFYWLVPKPIATQQLFIFFFIPTLLSILTLVWCRVLYGKRVIILDSIKFLSFKAKLDYQICLPLAFSCAILIFIATFLFLNSSNFTSIPKTHEIFISTPPEDNISEQISEYKEKLRTVELNWYKLNEGEAACKLVRRSQPSELGGEFTQLGYELGSSENKLQAKIEAYRSAQYAYIMASDTACDANDARDYAMNSIRFGQLALELIAQAQDVSGEYGRSLREWLLANFTEERIYFHNALGYALLYRWGDTSLANDLRSSLDKIEHQDFYEENAVNIDNDRLISPFLEHTLPKESDFSHPCQKTCGFPNQSTE